MGFPFGSKPPYPEFALLDVQPARMVRGEREMVAGYAGEWDAFGYDTHCW